MTGARTRRAERIRAAMPIVDQLTGHTSELNDVWWARHVSDENPSMWVTTPFSVNPRGDEALAESNYEVIQADLERVAAFGTDYRIDLWPGGRIFTLQVRVDDALALRAVDQWITWLEDNSGVADEDDLSAREWRQNHPGDGQDLCYFGEGCSCDRERA